MKTIEKEYLSIINDLYEIICIQRDTIKELRGDSSPVTGDFDLRSINQDILKGANKLEVHKNRPKKS